MRGEDILENIVWRRGSLGCEYSSTLLRFCFDLDYFRYHTICFAHLRLTLHTLTFSLSTAVHLPSFHSLPLLPSIFLATFPSSHHLHRRLETPQYKSALALIDTLFTELKCLDDKAIVTEVHLLESRVYHGIGNMAKAKVGPQLLPPLFLSFHHFFYYQN